ncbi:acyl carrier protein [Streptomyces sp. NPDC005492]|uniref:acyl carrier protein n=1 Tax=Streptomyces sp. NPDC005492 TaxID=3156883 RepID=UPI0033BD44BB
MITRENVQELVIECLSMGGEPVEVDVDSTIVVDSFSLVWLQHVLEERYDLVIVPDRSDMESFTSVKALHEYLAKTFPDRVSVEE